MQKVLSVLAGAVVLLATAEAWALLIEKSDPGWPDDPLELTYFYPYPTTYRGADRGFAFEDDPLTAIVPEPATMKIIIRRTTVRRTMVLPRMNFVQEMYRSTEAM
jgi:hypothetical protein